MVSSSALVIAGICGLAGLTILSQARRPYSRQKTLTEIMSTPEGREELGKKTILRGQITVTDPAIPERPPPSEVAEKVTSPALWAWRVRHQSGTGTEEGRGPQWETIEGGLAVGEFTIQQDWDRVRVDSDWLTSELESMSPETNDPFETANLYFREPEIDIPLGELNPLNKLFERLGLRDDSGIVTNTEAQISFGGETTSPDRYQSTIIQNGDELVLRGELVEMDDNLVLRGTDETPLVVTTGDLEQKAHQLRSKALWQSGFGIVLLLLAAAAVTTGVL